MTTPFINPDPDFTPLEVGPSWYDGRWPFERSDITPDERVRFLRLPNGFRTAVIDHPRPKGRLNVWLVVQAGALMEEEDHGGVAHFLEHMAFNGSSKFKPGELIDFFMQEGMDFGEDANAYTDIAETVYTLQLPDNTPEKLKMAVTVLHDMAQGLTLTDEEILRERNVILAERKAHQSQDDTLDDEWLTFLYPKSVLSRPVIGTLTSISALTGEAVRAFYKTWYVPERMVLVVAGDVSKLDNVEDLLSDTFGTLPKSEVLPYVTNWGEAPSPGFDALAQTSTGTQSVFTLTSLFASGHLPDNRRQERLEVMNTLARAIVERRLDDLREAYPHLWNEASFECNWREGFTPHVTLGLEGDVESEEERVDIALRLWKRLQTAGITQEELDWAKGLLRLGLETAQQDMKSVQAGEAAARFVECLTNDSVYTDPVADLKRFTEDEPGITVDDVNQMLQAALSGPVLRLGLSSPTPRTSDALKAWGESILSETVTDEKESASSVSFPYLTPAEPTGNLPAPTTLPAPLGAKRTRTVYPNGWTIECLAPQEDDGRLTMSLILEGGMSALNDSELTALRYGVLTLGQAGLGALTQRDFMEQLGLYGVSVTETLNEVASIITVSGPTGSVEKAVAALYTHYWDPQITPAALQRTESLLRAQEQNRLKTVEDGAEGAAPAFFFGDSPKTQNLNLAQFKGLGVERLRSVIEQVRRAGTRTLVVTGTVDDTVIDPLLWKTFGGLPKVTAVDAPTGAQSSEHFNAGAEETLVVPGDAYGKSHTTAVWHYDVPDTEERPKLRIALALLGDITTERLRKLVREEKGLAYAPEAAYQVINTQTGLGVLAMEALTKKHDVPSVHEAFSAVAERLRTEPLTSKDRQQVVQPALSRWRHECHEGSALHERLVRECATGKPELARWAEMDRLIESVTVDDLTRLAKAVFASPSARLTVVSATATHA